MRILVLGAGVSGLAAASLASRTGNAVAVYDANPDRAASIISREVAALTGQWDPGYLDGIDLVVTSPGFTERSAPITDAYERGVPVESELEWAWKQLDSAMTVAVTGTNGKTTVTTLIAQMLAASGTDAAAIGNIGEAVSDVVQHPPRVAVVEISSAQLQLTSEFRPHVAVITNVGSDHVDWHGSTAAYHAAKRKIVVNQGDTDHVVFSSNDPGASAIAASSAARQIGVDQMVMASHGYGGNVDSVFIGGIQVSRSDLSVSPGPFVQDILLAAAAAGVVGADPDAMASVASGFTTGDHRQRLIATIAGVDYVDDSKATNPDAALAAIDAFESVVLIAGGQSKGNDIAALVRRPNVKAVFAMGESAELLVEAAPEITHEVASMSEAVAAAHRVASPGDVVLLSPGGASWDMFDSYGHRGDVFATEVSKIAERAVT